MNSTLEIPKLSAFEDLKTQFHARKEEILKLKAKECVSDPPYLHDVESPTCRRAKLARSEKHRSKIDWAQDNMVREADPVSIPIGNLILLKGTFNRKNFQVLKDDECNTNIVSRDFVEHNKEMLIMRKKPMVRTHSEIMSDESSDDVIIDRV